MTMTATCRMCSESLASDLWDDIAAFNAFHAVACFLGDEALYFHITNQEQEAQ